MNRRIVVHLVGGKTLTILGESYSFTEGDQLEIYQGLPGSGQQEVVATFLRPQVVGVCDADAVIMDEGGRGQEGPADAGEASTFGEQRGAEEWRRSHRPDDGPATVGDA